MIGKFKVLENFGMRRRNEFYLIGEIAEGTFEKGAFVDVPVSPELSLDLKIKEFEFVEVAKVKASCILLVVEANEKEIDLLLKVEFGEEALEVLSNKPMPNVEDEKWESLLS